MSNPDLDKNLKFRPGQNEIDEFEKYLVDFWNLFTDVFKGVKEYVGATDNAALPYRNRETGGLMYFRPIALPRLITAILETCFRKDIQLSECMSIYSEMEMCISKEPWINILWDPIKQTMIMTHSSIIDKLLMFLYDSTMLTDREITAFKKKYAKALNIDINNIEAQLEKIKMY